MTEQLKTLKLTGMQEALSEQLQTPQAKELSFEERLSLLLDREIIVRTNRLMQSRLRQAKLHISQATLADINYRADRQLDKKQILSLGTGDWLEQRHNLILTGATGTGKSYLACALAHKACMLGYRAQYWRVTRLLEELDLSKADGRYLSLIKSLAKFQLLILDDWAMVKLQGQHQQLVLDVLDDRYQKTSTIITSQLPVTAWYEQIQDKTFADAILDRLLGQAQIIQLSGASLRQKQKKKNKT
jgi:DNA replication protein DnaC